MTKGILHNTGFSVVFLIILSFQSCSIIGFGIGRQVDRSLPPQKHLHPTWVNEFEPEMKIKVVNKKGFVYKGVFHGLDTIPMTYDTLISVMMETASS